MGDLAGVVAQPNAPIIGRSSKPDRTPVGAFVQHLPETDVMPPVGAPAVGLFECELLLLALVVEGVDRCAVMGPVQYHAPGDRNAGAKRDGIGRKPARR